MRIFSYPVVVKELLMSFVHEDFVKDLEFASLKRLNPDFFPASEKSRHADVIYEITSHGKTAYIYLFIEFQSTVDWFMPLRMARYMLEFYDELRRSGKQKLLNPAFAILLYSGEPVWNAPEKLSDLLLDSSIPKEYLPEFRYHKIAINEIPKRDLVKLCNAVAAVFYIENSNPSEINKNYDELVYILREVIKKTCGLEIVQQLINRIFEIYRLPQNSITVTGIEDLMEVKNMLETKTKIWEKEILEKGRKEGREEGKAEGIVEGFEKGIKKGIEKGIKQGIDMGLEKTAINMIKIGETDSKIGLCTGLSIEQIEQLRIRIQKENR
jgi:predicted transposase/invertase (TIGR01784 family)